MKKTVESIIKNWTIKDKNWSLINLIVFHPNQASLLYLNPWFVHSLIKNSLDFQFFFWQFCLGLQVFAKILDFLNKLLNNSLTFGRFKWGDHWFLGKIFQVSPHPKWKFEVNPATSFDIGGNFGSFHRDKISIRDLIKGSNGLAVSFWGKAPRFEEGYAKLIYSFFKSADYFHVLDPIIPVLKMHKHFNYVPWWLRKGDSLNNLVSVSVIAVYLSLSEFLNDLEPSKKL